MEKWKAVVGGRYEVSDRGAIRSVLRKDRLGRWVGGHPIKCSVDHDGYVYFCASINGKKSKRKVHLLVAEAFNGRRPPGLEANHKDGKKTRNVPTNIEYTTRCGNAAHAAKYALMPTKVNGRWRRKWRP